MIGLGLLGACTDVGKCTRGEQDCACGDNDSCDSGLICRDDRCVVEGSGGMGGAGGMGGTAGTGGTGGNLCGAPTPKQPTPVHVTCDALTYDEACVEYCQILCLRLEWFCDVPCDLDECQPTPELLTACQEDGCPLTDAGCLNDLCETNKRLSCQEAASQDFCGADAPIDCSSMSCDNSCDPAELSADVIGDGDCDDGDESNADYNICAYGTDCADCGPRPLPEPACLAAPAECTFGSSCCGFDTDEAFCVELDSDTGLSRCASACTDDGDCDTGFSCTPLDVQQSMSSLSACLPDCAQ